MNGPICGQVIRCMVHPHRVDACGNRHWVRVGDKFAAIDDIGDFVNGQDQVEASKRARAEG